MNELNFSLFIFLVIPLLLIEGLFSGSEMALLSADRLQLKKKMKSGSHSAGLALSLIEHPERIFSATLLMTSLCVVGISALVSIYFLTHQGSHSELISVAVTSPLVVFFGELIPKVLYRRFANTLAPWVAYPVVWAFHIFYPITRLLSLYTNRLSQFVRPMEALVTGHKQTTRDALRSLITAGKKESEIKTSEKKMIRRILDFKDAEARNALIPLVRVDALEESTTVKVALEYFRTHRHSRHPVYSERIDNIVGILELFDLLNAKTPSDPILKHLKPAHYAPETQTLPDLLLDMREKRVEMSIVVDEHGGAVGIITFEDIVEEIVGDINDEFDRAQLTFKEVDPNSWVVQAGMEVEAFNEHLHLQLPHGDYETLSGFLLQQFGRIPANRDELYFSTPAGLLRFTIRKATDRRIETVLVERLESSSP